MQLDLSGKVALVIGDKTKRRDLEEAREPIEFPVGRIPLTDGRPGTAAQVAQLVLFLGAEALNHIRGSEIWIDGAESLLQG